MNKLFLVLCTLACFLCFSSESHGSEDLSVEDIRELLISNEAADLSCGHFNGDSDYQTVAKFYGVHMFSENPNWNERKTNIFSYKKDSISGTIFHIAWYVDGYIITQINGLNEGYQTVFLGDSIMSADVIGVSYPSSREENTDMNTDRRTNKYSWGTVYTIPDRQYVIRTNLLEK